MVPRRAFTAFVATAILAVVPLAAAFHGWSHLRWLQFALYSVGYAALAVYGFLAGGRLRIAAGATGAIAVLFPLLLTVGAFTTYDTLWGNLAWPLLAAAGLLLAWVGLDAPPLLFLAVIVLAAEAIALNVALPHGFPQALMVHLLDAALAITLGLVFCLELRQSRAAT